MQTGAEALEDQLPLYGANKRYYSLYAYNNRRFGGRLYKAVLDCGMDCPNRDGTRGRGGCAFCAGRSGYFTGSGDVTAQLQAESTRIWQKHPGVGLTAYFQAGTNTYAPLAVLRQYFEQAAAFPGVKALAVATRPDCLPTDVCDYLQQLARRIPLTVELGLQTVHDVTAQKFGRGYSYAEFVQGFERLRDRGIRVCIHLINGLPGETEQDMLVTAQRVGALAPGGVKLQLLHVLRDTALCRWYEQGQYTPMTFTQYTRVTAAQLRYFAPGTVIERLTGDGDKARLVEPVWSRDKIRVLGEIDHILALQNWMQGDLYECGHNTHKEGKAQPQ